MESEVCILIVLQQNKSFLFNNGGKSVIVILSVEICIKRNKGIPFLCEI